MKEEMWGDQVQVVSCDMRHWTAPEKADILVSELLGSFGDNELSPECLDGAQRFLKGQSSHMFKFRDLHKWFYEVHVCRDLPSYMKGVKMHL